MMREKIKAYGIVVASRAESGLARDVIMPGFGVRFLFICEVMESFSLQRRRWQRALRNEIPRVFVLQGRCWTKPLTSPSLQKIYQTPGIRSALMGGCWR